MASEPQFQVLKVEGAARTGILRTAHGEVLTPAFMPVATHGALRAFPHHLLEKASILLSNTYHLYLRPGTAILEAAGGLHRFMGWNKPILTDSGGYQVFSLAPQRKLSPEGVLFKSHVDGSTHLLTPEKVVAIQRSIGSDIQMVLDVCPPYPASDSEMREALELTHAWAARARRAFLENPTAYGYPVLQFGIVQGGVEPELRRASFAALKHLDFEGWAVGGLAVGEPFELRQPILHLMGELLPPEKPRYIMGIGTPLDILEAVAAGMDMMDCVLPTRNARHGRLYTWEGIIHIRNARYKSDLSPLPPWGYTRAYLHHLFRVEDPLAQTIATAANLTFFLELMEHIRLHITQGTFLAWKAEIAQKLMQPAPK
ncbi:MAG: tRNA guanosine(34) transglycosylase Tgt [Bacteroidia bacterium]|nr:tRNA guanosine(34) transglycosylase Tgt [Bacteroidia bacterium]MCX7764191.1 tRNA guanosine(34) transglycosylase Tgt [Bacteroidia bacterium]MDW8057245.1 tRNA guanosine(34) transglycosylase Tgt [Bacteroidia bacterium]